ncbi:MAG: hypothetical protein ACK4UZ_13660, partial [Rhizobium rhizophilum]
NSPIGLIVLIAYAHQCCFAAPMMLFFCPDALNALRTGRQIAGDGRPACMGENLCGRDAKKNDVFKKNEVRLTSFSTTLPLADLVVMAGRP